MKESKEYRITAHVDGSIEITLWAESEEDAQEIAEREIEGGELLVKWGGVGIDGTVSLESVNRIHVSEEG